MIWDQQQRLLQGDLLQHAELSYSIRSRQTGNRRADLVEHRQQQQRILVSNLHHQRCSMSTHVLHRTRAVVLSLTFRVVHERREYLIKHLQNNLIVQSNSIVGRILTCGSKAAPDTATELTAGAICPEDMLRNTNRAEMQVSRVERISGSAGSYWRHSWRRRSPEQMGGRSWACSTRLSTLSRQFDRASHSWCMGSATFRPNVVFGTWRHFTSHCSMYPNVTRGATIVACLKEKVTLTFWFFTK